MDFVFFVFNCLFSMKIYYYIEKIKNKYILVFLGDKNF